MQAIKSLLQAPPVPGAEVVVLHGKTLIVMTEDGWDNDLSYVDERDPGILAVVGIPDTYYVVEEEE